MYETWPRTGLAGEGGWGFASPFATAEELEDGFAYDQPYAETAPAFEGEGFPSGLVLSPAKGATGERQEHWDPHNTGLPLLATGPAVRGQKLSPKFTVGELVKSGGRYADAARISPALVRLLQGIRDRAGKSVHITSGYRSWARNKQVYAGYGKTATLSRHCSGQAADIRIPGMSGLDIARLAIDVGGPDLGIGIGGAYAHVDVRGSWAVWTYLKGDAGKQAVAAIVHHRAQRSGQSVPPPSQTPPPRPVPQPVPVTPGVTSGGELVLDRHPVLRAHAGSAPDLVLRWNAMSNPATIDVIVHFHGFSASRASMNLRDEILPISGLDLTGPGGAGPARTRPTLAILPRGHYYGGDSGRGYSFPKLTARGALRPLIDDALARFTAKTGISAPMGRLILTGHSGGGAPLSAILGHPDSGIDPDEVIVYDGLYGSGDAVLAWARRRIAAELAAPSAVLPALRVFYRRGSQKYPGTQPHSEALGKALCQPLADPAAARLRPRFRVELTSAEHGDMPRRFGRALLADAGVDVPGATRHDCSSRTKEAEGFDTEDVVLEGEGFPSGAVLDQASGATGKGQEHWDPQNAGLPLLATGASKRSVKLSPNFTVSELVTSGGRPADVARISPALVRLLQAIRDRAGKPVRIGSGYRSWASNKALYASRGKQPTLSRHCSGQAADITIKGLSGLELAKIAIDVGGPNLGIGLARTFAHVDVRGSWALWNYVGGAEGQRLEAAITAHRAARKAGTPPPVPVKTVPQHPATPPAGSYRHRGLVPYQKATTDSKGPQPGARALEAHWRRSTGLQRVDIYNPRAIRGKPGTVSVHSEGRALDLYANANDPAQKATTEKYIAWLMANAVELQVQYIIWNRRAWSWQRRKDGWRPYKGQSPHTDHVHVELSWEGARTPSPLLAGGMTGEAAEGWESPYAEAEGEGWESTYAEAEAFDGEDGEEEGYDSEGWESPYGEAEAFDGEDGEEEGYDSEGWESPYAEAEGIDGEDGEEEGYDSEAWESPYAEAEASDGEDGEEEGYDSERWESPLPEAEAFEGDGYEAEDYEGEWESSEGEGYETEGETEEHESEGYEAEGYRTEGYETEAEQYASEAEEHETQAEAYASEAGPAFESETAEVTDLCGFFAPTSAPVTTAAVRARVVAVARGEQTLWRSSTNALQGESVNGMFGHLIRYWLAERASIPAANLVVINARIPNTAYGATLLGAATVAATTVNAEARRIARLLIRSLPEPGTPANLEALVIDAIKSARRSKLNEIAWSAAFINSCVRRAGMNLNLQALAGGGEESLLKLSPLGRHWEYLLEAHRRRFGCRTGPTTFDAACRRKGTYQAFRITEFNPQAGDIIVQDRNANSAAAVLTFDQIPGLTGLDMHADIVVDVQPGFAETIGGNVGQTVRRRRYPLTTAGALVVSQLQQFVAQNTNGSFPPMPAAVAIAPAVFHTESTARIVALLRPVQECRKVVA